MYPYPESLFSPDYFAAVQAVNIALIIFTIVPFIAAFYQWTRPPQIMDFWIFVLIGTVWCCFQISPLHHQIRATAAICATVSFLAVAFFGLITMIRLASSDQASRFWTFFSLACGIVIIFFTLMPTVQSAREAARRTQCANNMKQIGLAMHNYHDYLKSFPAAHGRNRSGHQVSWRIHILPFAEQENLYDEYDQDQAWDSPANTRVARQDTYFYQCPSNWIVKDREERYFSAYSIPTGPDTFFGEFENPRLKDATWGSSNTIMVVEACGQEIVWTEPRDVNLETDPIGTNLAGHYRGH